MLWPFLLSKMNKYGLVQAENRKEVLCALKKRDKDSCTGNLLSGPLEGLGTHVLIGTISAVNEQNRS